MWVTLKDLKKKWRWKARSKMTNEELEYFISYIKKCRDETTRLELLLEAQNKASKEAVIISPMYLPIRKKRTPDKKISLNMNWYRNIDFITNNNVKQSYKELIEPYIDNLWQLKDIHIEYTVYYWSKEPDWMNIVSVISKFFLDALQEEWKIKNDNISNVTESYKNWWKDIWNERIEIRIRKPI